MTDNQQPNLAFKPLKEDENYLIYSDDTIINTNINMIKDFVGKKQR